MIGGRGRAAQAARQERARQLCRAMTVRYRSDGHVRFDLPDALRTPGAAMVLEDGLGRIDGVYRVHVFLGAGKLSIRYMPDVCGLAGIAKALSALVADAAEADPSASLPSPSLPVVAASDGGAARPGWLERIKASAPIRSVRQRYEDLRAKADILARIVAVKTGKPVPGGGDIQEWAIHFFNDLVAFYLIRTHWDRIIGQWLPRPWAYRYQWLTVIYLTFLLVRYRKGAVPKVRK